MSTNDTKIARLDERMNGLAATVSEIKDNHLVHLAADIKELREGQVETNLTIAKWSGGIGAIVVLFEILLKIWK